MPGQRHPDDRDGRDPAAEHTGGCHGQRRRSLAHAGQRRASRTAMAKCTGQYFRITVCRRARAQADCGRISAKALL